MKRCSRCVMPDTRPDVPFTDGVCQACLNHDNRPTIDWGARAEELGRILYEGRNSSGFDCIVPSSGGKDSHWQALKLIELGVRPLVVTASTCHLTPIGRANIDNLARYATTIEVTPNREVRAKLNRLGLELVGDISWPEHAGIFTTPFRVAAALGVPLIFYGENPQNQYGGPQGTEEAKQLTRRWRSEFGGFLGQRPADMVGQAGITERDMMDYALPPETQLEDAGIRAYFLGQFFPWDSERNAQAAINSGMRAELPCQANWWPAENLDNAQTGLHDHAMYRKYGYGRLATQISVDIRNGRISRESALATVLVRDGLFPMEYAGVKVETVLERLKMTLPELISVLNSFTDWSLFKDVQDYRPILKEES